MNFLNKLQGGLTVAQFIPGLNTVAGLANAAIDVYKGDYGSALLNVLGAIPIAGVAVKAIAITAKIATVASKAKFVKAVIIAGKIESKAEKVKYIGRLSDLKDVSREMTLLDQLPNLGNPKANYYQNMSVLRKSLRDGYKIIDKSAFRPNSELAPTLLNPNRTVGQTFLGAERNLIKNRGL